MKHRVLLRNSKEKKERKTHEGGKHFATGRLLNQRCEGEPSKVVRVPRSEAVANEFSTPPR